MSNRSIQAYDPCICESGKKYKFCCMKKSNKSGSTKLDTTSQYILESFNVTAERLTKTDFDDEREELSPEDEKLLRDITIELKVYPQRIKSEVHPCFGKLKELIKKYPNNPVFYNQLGVGYQILGKQEKLNEIIDQVYEKFPNYLFGIVGKANSYLEKDLPDKFFEVFAGKYTLKQLYPNRETFHIDEVKAFHFAFFQCYCFLGELDKAENNLVVLKNILTSLGREDDREFMQMQEIFYQLSHSH